MGRVPEGAVIHIIFEVVGLPLEAQGLLWLRDKFARALDPLNIFLLVLFQDFPLSLRQGVVRGLTELERGFSGVGEGLLVGYR